MKHAKRARRKSEPQGLLLFSVALLLISPIETSDERAHIEGLASVANKSSTSSAMRN
jgi:hypothetical protein